MAFQTRTDLQNQAIGWLRKECRSLGGGTVVRFPRIWIASGECRIKSLVGAKFDIGMGVTLDNRQFRQILNMASSLFKIRFQNEAQKTKEFEKLLDRCGKVAKRRNRVMHRLWTLDKKGQVVSLAHEVRGGIGLKANRQVVRVTELQTLYRDIMKLRDDLLTARERLIAGSIKGAP